MSNAAPLSLVDAATAVRKSYEADIILYFGEIARPKDDFVIDECLRRKKHKNVLLVICTYGGDAHAAYRIARALQRNYSNKGGTFYAFVNSACNSAGTLLVMGADELILSDHAELGPIDVQLMKQDEVGERTSGLTPIQALQYLCFESVNVFNQHFAQMRFKRGFPTSLASKLSADVSSGLMGKLYEQIDPMKLAEIYRFLQIADHYGQRIQRNLRDGALKKLLMSYPAHDCVIDRLEAEELFQRVRCPCAALENFGNLLKGMADQFLNGNEPHVTYFLDDLERDETISASSSPVTAATTEHENAPEQRAADAPNAGATGHKRISDPANGAAGRS